MKPPTILCIGCLKPVVAGRHKCNRILPAMFPPPWKIKEKKKGNRV